MALRVGLRRGLALGRRLVVVSALSWPVAVGAARAESAREPAAAAPPAGRIVDLADVAPTVPVAEQASAVESVSLPGKNGEPVTVRMRKGGLGGWIQRNRPYRKRKAGEEPATIAANPGTVADKGRAAPAAPASVLAALREVRDGAPEDRSGAAGTGTPGLATFGPLEVELLGLTAAVAITSPADVIEGGTAPAAAAAQSALDDLARRLGPVGQKHHGEITRRDDHVALLFLLPAAAQTGKSPAEVALVTEIGAAVQQLPGSTIEIRGSAGGAGKSGADARRAAEKRLSALTGLLRGRGFDEDHVRGQVVPMAQGVGQGGQTGDSLIVFRVWPPPPDQSPGKP